MHNWPDSRTRGFEFSLPGDLLADTLRLIRMRWLAGGMVFFATFFCVRVLGLDLPEIQLYIMGGVILAYNAVLVQLVRRYDVARSPEFFQQIRRHIVLQIALDWLSMGLFLHLTGGVTSPLIVFFFIHLVIVNILLPGQSPYSYVGVAVLMLLTIALLEGAGIIPHYNPIQGIPRDLCKDPIYILSEIVFLAVGLIAIVFVSSSIMARLREHERQIAALLRTAQDVNSTLDLSATLERLAYNAAQALNVQGASIRLLGTDGEQLRIVGSYGLSRMYLNKGPVELSSSQIDREALAGQTVIISDTAGDQRVQYPREMQEEGIHSLLVLPIIGQGGPLGVLRVYSSQPGYFTQHEADFVMAIAQQGAIAIENALAHEALQQAEGERAQFVRIVTHELRAPVTGAQSLLAIMARNMAGELTDQQRDIVGRLEKRFEHLLSLISDLLQFAAGKTVNMNAQLVPVSLSAVIGAVVEQARPQALQKRIELAYSATPRLVEVMATPDGVTRIVENLLTNAIKYTPEGGSVKVSVLLDSGAAQVSVSDTGIGIPAEEVQRLGEEFFRASNAKQSQISGTGLGLTIVRQLTALFGGVMSVHSVVGEGSTFTITLPLIGAGTAQAAPH